MPADSNHADPMLDLFRLELDSHTSTMMGILLQGESECQSDQSLEQLMRSSHSIKGAARLVNQDWAVKIAHVLEDCFVAAQKKQIQISAEHVDHFIHAIDLLKNIASSKTPNDAPEIEQLCQLLSQIQTGAPVGTTPANETDTAISHEPISFKSCPVPDPIMLELFQTEMENNLDKIASQLIAIEANPRDSKLLEDLMRAAHSIKGAAKLVGIDAVVKLSHEMEDCFVAAQKGKLHIEMGCVDLMLRCVDTMRTIQGIEANNIDTWTARQSQALSGLIHQARVLKSGGVLAGTNANPAPSSRPKPSSTPTSNAQPANTQQDSIVRVSAKRIDQLMSLAGELSVNAAWIRHYTQDMLQLKKSHSALMDYVSRLRDALSDRDMNEHEQSLLNKIEHRADNYRDKLSHQLEQLDDFDRRSNDLTSRMNHEIIASRMRPFKDGIQGYQRMVRDISRSLDKKIQLKIIGEDTQVDRDILEKIEAPVNHMIRNAIDHGIESPAERIAAGKPEFGTIRLEARHNAGRLLITVSDDGRGVDIETIRSKVLERNLVSPSMAENLSRSELLDFLFLPAFSTRDKVTEISGRGVGLDVVHSTLQELRGKLRADTRLGEGMSILLELPLTLSVIRSLLCKINNELYAFPLAGIHSLYKASPGDILTMEDKQYIRFNEQNIGLIAATQILGRGNSQQKTGKAPIVIIGDLNQMYGIVVNDLLGEKGLALRPLDPRLGKIRDINAAAMTDEGDPILVFDVDDLMHSINDIISGKDLQKIGAAAGQSQDIQHILVVDDSLTVREVEKKLLESRGYRVDVAVDGVDGWNTVRLGKYQLVITDVDMPRMNGIELVRQIKNDAALRDTPVMMVSYKDRPEDKNKGLEAGADYYLTKGSFHDETLLDAVIDLIGEPE